MNIAQRLRSIVGNGGMGIVLEPAEARLLSDAADSIEMLGESNDKLRDENTNLRELSVHALKYIERERCDDPAHELWHGKPCDSCADAGSSDCPKVMAKMFGHVGIKGYE